MRRRTDPVPLLLCAAAGVVGHAFVMQPVLDAVGGWSVTRLISAAAPRPPAPPMRDGPFIAPFAASSAGASGAWEADFRGRIGMTSGGVVVTVPSPRVGRRPGAGPAALLALRVDLAERTPDGAWTVLERGTPVDVSRRVHDGETLTLEGVDLFVPRVGARALASHVLVVTLVVRAGAEPSLVHVPLDAALAGEVADRALAWEERERARRLGAQPPRASSDAATSRSHAPVSTSPPTRTWTHTR